MLTPSQAHPAQCPVCESTEVRCIVMPYSTEIKYEGAVHTVSVKEMPALSCDVCGEVVIDPSGQEAIYDTLRGQLGLLTRSQIKANRESLGTQRELANAIGVASETVSRWESGSVVQSRASDNMLRAYFGLPEVRQFFLELPSNPSLGIAVVWHETPSFVQGSADIFVTCGNGAMSLLSGDGDAPVSGTDNPNKPIVPPATPQYAIAA